MIRQPVFRSLQCVGMRAIPRSSALLKLRTSCANPEVVSQMRADGSRSCVKVRSSVSDSPVCRSCVCDAGVTEDGVWPSFAFRLTAPPLRQQSAAFAEAGKHLLCRGVRGSFYRLV